MFRPPLKHSWIRGCRAGRIRKRCAFREVRPEPAASSGASGAEGFRGVWASCGCGTALRGKHAPLRASPRCSGCAAQPVLPPQRTRIALMTSLETVTYLLQAAERAQNRPPHRRRQVAHCSTTQAIPSPSCSPVARRAPGPGPLAAPLRQGRMCTGGAARALAPRWRWPSWRHCRRRRSRRRTGGPPAAGSAAALAPAAVGSASVVRRALRGRPHPHHRSPPPLHPACVTCSAARGRKGFSIFSGRACRRCSPAAPGRASETLF